MNSIKTYIGTLGRGVRTVILALAVVFVSAGIAQAATTISTSILTNGTLGATGVSTFGATASTTISAAGLLVTPGATVNGTLDVIGISTFGATASTTISAAGAVSMPSTLSVTGLSSLSFASSTLFSANSAYFGASATSTFSSAGALTLEGALTLQNDEVITNATDGVVSIAGASYVVKILGTASTSALIVGDEPAAPTISGMVFGYCSFANVTSFTATTTQYVDCTTSPTGALLATDRVFVQATSSWDTSFVIVAASSTAVSTINLRLPNLAIEAEDTTLHGTS